MVPLLLRLLLPEVNIFLFLELFIGSEEYILSVHIFKPLEWLVWNYIHNNCGFLPVSILHCTSHLPLLPLPRGCLLLSPQSHLDTQTTWHPDCSWRLAHILEPVPMHMCPYKNTNLRKFYYCSCNQFDHYCKYRFKTQYWWICWLSSLPKNSNISYIVSKSCLQHLLVL